MRVARDLVRGLARPMAVDADALTALAGHLDLLREAPAARCLTPHPGEMARMLGARVDDVQRDRIQTVRDFATGYRVHVLLKGARSVIGDPDGRVFVNPTGNPGMASGGTGDVLTGMLGAFLARGIEPGAALRASVYLHGSAGDVAAERAGEEALIARDVIDAIPEAFRRLHAAGG
jgi:NAD(P)H-hydrate epimerase